MLALKVLRHDVVMVGQMGGAVAARPDLAAVEVGLEELTHCGGEARFTRWCLDTTQKQCFSSHWQTTQASDTVRQLLEGPTFHARGRPSRTSGSCIRC